MPPKPSLLVLPRPALFHKLFSPAAGARLQALAQTRYNETEDEWTTEQLAKTIGSAEILITGWGSPKLTPAVLDQAPNLKLVAHSAGTVKFMLDESLLARGIKVSTAGFAMVDSVAEFTCLLSLLMLRPVHKLDAALRAGQSWAELKIIGVGDELASQTVGVVGAGQIGTRVAQMLRAWKVPVRLYDPFLTPERAGEMDVHRCATLAELLTTSRIVTLHAPILPETRHMIGREQLALMKDNSILLNTARAWLVDADALALELRAGRLRCATDVYDNEPLPEGDPWRSMPNALLTPHVASYTHQTFDRMGNITADEVERFVRGEPLKYEVTPKLLKTMA